VAYAHHSFRSFFFASSIVTAFVTVFW